MSATTTISLTNAGWTLLYTASGLDIPYVCSGSANLFAVAINRAGTTPAATDAMTFKYHMVRD